jgi:hypothetical protein
MIVRIALIVATLALAVFAFRHPAPRGAVQSISVATPSSNPDPVDSGARHHRRFHRAAPAGEVVVYVAGAILATGTLKRLLRPAAYEHRPTQPVSTSPSVPPTVKRSMYPWPVKRRDRGRARVARAGTVRRLRQMAVST